MAIALATKFQPYTDEQFKNESKLTLVTNRDFDWTGAHTVKVYKVTTAAMNDYGRTGAATGNWSRYGAIGDLTATTEELTLTKDRSFIFNIDKLDQDETAQQVAAASALARQNREVVIPEIDTYVYGVMADKAGTKATAKALAAAGIYADILAGSKALDDAEVPETERVLIVTPATYLLMKQSPDIVLETDVGQDMRLRGVITFVMDDVDEYSFLYTADGFTGQQIACSEGSLEWVPREQVLDLPIWEGDRLMFQLLNQRQDVFSLKLNYVHDVLVGAAVDGAPCRMNGKG